MVKPLSGRLIDSLRTLGLTEYEARVYSTLTLLGHADAKQVYEYLGASKPNVYESLNSLVARGFVIVVSARPALYKPVPPDLVLKHLIETHQQAEEAAREELEALRQMQGAASAGDVLWTLFGERNIAIKLEELLTGATRSVRGVMLTGDYAPLEHLKGRVLSTDLLVKDDPQGFAKRYGLKSARVRRVSRTGFRSDDEDFAEFHRMMSDDVMMFIVDDREFVYLLPTNGSEPSAITSQNPALVRMTGLIFNMAWRRSE